jgi:hypothetical protein
MYQNRTEALIKEVNELAFSMPAPNPYIDMFIYLCLDAERASMERRGHEAPSEWDQAGQAGASAGGLQRGKLRE